MQDEREGAARLPVFIRLTVERTNQPMLFNLHYIVSVQPVGPDRALITLVRDDPITVRHSLDTVADLMARATGTAPLAPLATAQPT
jgi:hypothetical protein